MVIIPSNSFLKRLLGVAHVHLLEDNTFACLRKTTGNDYVKESQHTILQKEKKNLDKKTKLAFGSRFPIYLQTSCIVIDLYWMVCIIFARKNHHQAFFRERKKKQKKTIAARTLVVSSRSNNSYQIIYYRQWQRK